MSVVSITNQDDLVRFRHRFDLAEHIAVELGAGEIGLAANNKAPKCGWAVLHADSDRRVAVHLGNTIPARSMLSSMSVRLRSATVIAATVRQYCESEVTFVERDTIDEFGWWVVSTPSSDVPIWIALQGEWLLRDQTRAGLIRDPVVRVTLLGSIPEQGEITQGSELPCNALRMRLFGSVLLGRVVRVNERTMTLEIDGEMMRSSEVVPGVQLDLGEIEIKLSDLLNLRPGSSVEFALDTPLRGYLRCGVSKLACGEVVLSDGGIVLRVVEVFE